MISVFSNFAISSGKCSFEQELHILNPALLHISCCLFIFLALWNGYGQINKVPHFLVTILSNYCTHAADYT